MVSDPFSGMACTLVMVTSIQGIQVKEIRPFSTEMGTREVNGNMTDRKSRLDG